MPTKVKRKDFAAFLNTTPDESTETWSRFGKGITSMSISYNAETTSETYIDEDSGTTTVDSYAPTMDGEMTAYSGDAVFDFIDDLRQARAVGADAETQVLLVYIYDSSTASSTTTYKAEKQNVAIQIEDFGGEGGGNVGISYTVNFIGDATPGTCTIAGGVPTFTATT